MIDKKRGVDFSDPSEAAKWYEARLTEAQSALLELLGLLPTLVDICENYGALTLEDRQAIDKAQTYIDIYEGRTTWPTS